ncbi:MAG TPA: GNAT family N-acetyltransferase, partial [Micromonosporaceae bacterium]
RLPTCDGPRDEARAFGERYAAATGCGWETRMDQRLLVLRDVIPPRPAPGRCRPATMADADLIVAWAREFTAEAIPGQPPMEPEAVRRRLAVPETVWLWDVDDQPRSLCWQSPPAAGIVRVSLVYTPPGQRGHGYAGANVGAVTRTALDSGAAACMLYTDRANPTSNRVYEAIGYSYFGDAAEIEFVSPR